MPEKLSKKSGVALRFPPHSKKRGLSPQARYLVTYRRRVKDANTVATASLGLPVGSDRLLYGDWETCPIVES